MVPGPLSLLRRIYRFYFPSVSMDLPLACQRAEAKRRLKSEVITGLKNKVMWDESKGEAIAGKVDTRRVVLERLDTVNLLGEARSKNNAWKPILYADFRFSRGKLRLRGRFTIHPLVQIFTAIWLLGAASLTGYLLVMMFFGPRLGVDEPVPLALPGMGLALLAAGTALSRLGWHWSIDDIPVIEQFIRETVGEDSDQRDG